MENKILTYRSEGVYELKHGGLFDEEWPVWVRRASGKNTLCSDGKTSRTIIVKITHKCNLGCLYCYTKHRDDLKNGNGFMSEQVLSNLIRKFMSIPVEKINFIWHGGEPLLVGKNFYELIEKYQKTYTTGDNYPEIHNGIQTNGTLLNKELITFFKEKILKLV